MAKRKFGGYTIDYKKLNQKNQNDRGIVVCTVQLQGDIEIGIDIDTHTWRGDWLKDKLFGNKANQYDYISVENDYQSYTPVENNIVTAIFRERRY